MGASASYAVSSWLAAAALLPPLPASALFHTLALALTPAEPHSSSFLLSPLTLFSLPGKLPASSISSRVNSSMPQSRPSCPGVCSYRTLHTYPLWLPIYVAHCFSVSLSRLWWPGGRHSCWFFFEPRECVGPGDSAVSRAPSPCPQDAQASSWGCHAHHSFC